MTHFLKLDEIAFAKVDLIIPPGPGNNGGTPLPEDRLTNGGTAPATNELNPGTFVLLLPQDQTNKVATTLTLKADPTGGSLNLAKNGLDDLKIYTDEALQQELPIPKTWTNGDPTPTTLYMVGSSSSTNLQSAQGTLDLIYKTTLAADGGEYSIKDAVGVTLLPVELSSPKAVNTPWWKAEFGSVDIFDPRNPIARDEQKAIDSALTIYYNKVRKPDNSVEDFDIKLKFGPIDGATWSKFDGPDSGTLQNASQPEATYSKPKKGGLYRYDVHFAGKTTRTQAWLPKSGPDISSYWQQEINYFRNTWGPAYRSKLDSRTWFLFTKPITRAAVKHALALADMVEVGDNLDWMNPGSGQMINTDTSPEGGPNKGGDEWRYTIKGYVVDFRKRNNMMYALIGREMTLLELELQNGPNTLGAGTPDSPAALQSYEAGFDLYDGKSLEQAMKDYGFKMQEPESWAEREWPSDETTNEGLRRKAESQLNQLIQ